MCQIFQCIADFVISAGLATMLYLAVEAPFYRVINYLLRPSVVAKAVDTNANGTSADQQGNGVPEISHRKKDK
ncbi:hypothetical protein J6590_062563 [Homalodisca vitripennis]|nr:hypothetical protein J6590_062563 [Homalodisca vitripennis]